VQDVVIDHSLVLAIKRGDLSILQGEVFKCTPADENLIGIPLVLKRIDCVDRRIYDAKVYEFDTFMRFRGHPNLISLFSYWSEKPPSPYQYRSLVGLFEEGLLGDLLKTVVLNAVRPSNRQVMKYICDIAKGLLTLHSANIVHGSVKPSSIYLQRDNTCMLGEIGKTELDAHRHTH
jgi:serine/threonine protein kinase